MDITEIRMRQLKQQAEAINVKTARIPTGKRNEKRLLEGKARIMSCFNIGEKEWSDWKWQIKNRISDAESLAAIMKLKPEKLDQIRKVEKAYPWSVSPFYLSLIDGDIVKSPLATMCIPDILELSDTEGILDPMKEAKLCPAGCITRRYPDRVILNVTNKCGSYCRFCQRKRNIKKDASEISGGVLEQSLQYIRENTEIRDVLITGGDPFTLSDKRLEQLLKAVRNIKHVEIIRLGTRMPVYIPMRVTANLCNLIKQYSPVYINVHVNHPLEINYESEKAIEKLVDSGISVANQMVLLRGVNNDPYTVLVLNRELLRIKVRPYYMFHPKAVKGTMHFQCGIDEGLKIMELLRGRLSGLGIPAYVINCNGGWGKVPLLPDYLLSHNANKVSLRTWEGKVICLDLNHPGKFELEETPYEE